MTTTTTTTTVTPKGWLWNGVPQQDSAELYAFVHFEDGEVLLQVGRDVLEHASHGVAIDVGRFGSMGLAVEAAMRRGVAPSRIHGAEIYFVTIN